MLIHFLEGSSHNRGQLMSESFIEQWRLPVWAWAFANLTVSPLIEVKKSDEVIGCLRLSTSEGEILGRAVSWMYFCKSELSKLDGVLCVWGGGRLYREE